MELATDVCVFWSKKNLPDHFAKQVSFIFFLYFSFQWSSIDRAQNGSNEHVNIQRALHFRSWLLESIE